MWEWHDGPAWWAMALWMILFWGLVVAVILIAVRAISRGPRHRGGDAPAGASSARRILQERFARGEIEEEEFRRRSGALSG